MRNFFNGAKELLSQFWAWVSIRPRNAIIAASVFLAAVLGLILFIKFVLPAILAIACLIIIFFGEKIADSFSFQPAPPPLTLENDAVCYKVTEFSHEVFFSTHEVLSEFVHMPSSISDIYNPADYLNSYNNTLMLSLHLLRKQRDISDDDCAYIKNALQSKTNSRLRDGYLCGFLWAVPAAHSVPLIKIISVERSEMYLHIGVLLTNTSASVQAARLSDRPTPPPCGDDIDPLFRDR